MQEFAFELALATHLESEREVVVSRQLGTHVHGRRVMDLVCLEPGPGFEQRAAITPDAIPVAAIESDVGPGRATYWKGAFSCHPDRAAAAVEAAIDCGFFECERRNGRRYVRQTTRYPDWVGSILGIENKPDLGRPGDLETQLRTDVALGTLDAIVLATESYVTGAHRNRIPDEVGIWRFDPESGTINVLREPTQLTPRDHGVEILERQSGRTVIRLASPAEKERARLRIAERAYGKGWRTYDLPGCANCSPVDGLPYCEWKNGLVRPATACGTDCDGHESAEPPRVDLAAIRAERTPWRSRTAGLGRTQVGLDRFTE